MAVISVLIADDHLLLRETLLHVFARDDRFSAQAAACLTDVQQAIKDMGYFDVILLDVMMPGMQGLGSVTDVIARNAGGAVMLMSGSLQREFVEAVLQRGGAGYVPKTLPVGVLAEAVVKVAKGGRYVPLELHAAPACRAPEGLEALSRQEQRVLRYLCQGLSNKEIAREMAITETTIKTHMSAICTKLEAPNRTKAALIGARYLSAG